MKKENRAFHFLRTNLKEKRITREPTFISQEIKKK